MSTMTGARFMAETVHGYGIDTVFFMPYIAPRALMEMEKLGKLNEMLGPGEDENILFNAPTEEQHKVGRMLDMRIKLREAMDKLNERMAKEAVVRRDAIRRARVKVHSTIHPGVVLKIAGKVKEFSVPMDRSMFYYDPDKRELVNTGF